MAAAAGNWLWEQPNPSSHEQATEDLVRARRREFTLRKAPSAQCSCRSNLYWQKAAVEPLLWEQAHALKLPSYQQRRNITFWFLYICLPNIWPFQQKVLSHCSPCRHWGWQVSSNSSGWAITIHFKENTHVSSQLQINAESNAAAELAGESHCTSGWLRERWEWLTVTAPNRCDSCLPLSPNPPHQPLCENSARISPPSMPQLLLDSHFRAVVIERNYSKTSGSLRSLQQRMNTKTSCLSCFLHHCRSWLEKQLAFMPSIR